MPKQKATPTDDERQRLIEALKFVGVAIDKTDNTGLSQFVAIRDRWLISENETFCIGVNVDTQLELCLNAAKFEAALAQCSSNFALVQLNAHELSVKSGNFRAVVPVLASDTIAHYNPDPNIAAIDNRIMAGFRACAKLCSGKGDNAIHQSVLLRANSIVATNGGVALEYWHGIDLPPPMPIPKKTIDTLAKIDKPLIGFGYSPEASVTFWFDDLSFIKTRLISTPWPQTLDGIFNTNMVGTFKPLWRGFGDALSAVAKFVDEDVIYFHNGTLSTGPDLNHASASYLVEHLPNGHKFSAAYWRAVLPYVRDVKEAEKGKPFAFASDNVRGLIMERH